MVLLWRLSSQWRAENCEATARTSVLLILGLCPAISLWLSIMNNWPLSQFLLILPSAVSSHLAISDKLRNPEPNTTNNSDWSRAELLRLGSISSGDSLSYEVCSYHQKIKQNVSWSYFKFPEISLNMSAFIFHIILAAAQSDHQVLLQQLSLHLGDCCQIW